MRQPQPSFAEFQQPDSAKSTWPGAQYLPGYLDAAAQGGLAERCLTLGAEDAGFCTPIVRGGHPMSVRMLCLGRHWNAREYRYESVRSDVDGRPVPPLPAELANVARDIARAAGFAMAPDICIVNWYQADSRMGLHQDKDESPASLESGAPVVSISIGDTAKFLFGGVRRRDPVETILLQSGDAFVFGGPARLRYHGVSRILPGTAPAGLPFAGRLNLTFRQDLRRALVVPRFRPSMHSGRTELAEGRGSEVGMCDRHIRSAHDS